MKRDKSEHSTINRYLSFIITLCSCAGVLFGLLTIPYIPTRSFADKTAFLLTFTLFFLTLSLWTALRQISNELKDQRIPDKCNTVFVFGFTFLLLLIWTGRFLSPGAYAYIYNRYSFHSSPSVKDGDSTCLSIMESLAHNRSPLYLYAAGSTYFSAGDYGKAIFFFSEAMERGRTDANVNYMLGYSYLHDYYGDEELPAFENSDKVPSLIKACKYLNNAVKMKPDQIAYGYALAMANYYIFLNNRDNLSAYDDSLHHFNNIISLDKGLSAKYYFWRGHLQFLRNPSDAEDDFKLAVEKNDYEADYLYWLGRTYLATENAQEALDYFGQAQLLNQNDPEITYYLEQASALLYGSPDDGGFMYIIAGENKTESRKPKNISVSDGDVITLALHIADKDMQVSGSGPEDLRAAFILPMTVSKHHMPAGSFNIIDAGGNTNYYWDAVSLESEDYFYLEYITGTARYHSHQGSVSLPDDIIISGVVLDSELMDNMRLDFAEEAGYIAIDVRVNHSVTAKLSMTVRKSKSDELSESVVAAIGDEVEFEIEYLNLLAETVHNVMIRDVLPTNIQYVEDSTKIYNTNYPDGVRVIDNTLTTTGINIGSYAPRERCFVRFTGRIVDRTLADGANQLVNWASATIDNAVFKDDASVLLLK